MPEATVYIDTGDSESDTCRIDEQNRIVGLLDKLNAVKQNQTETEKELSELMPALLDKAFKGEL